MSRKIIETDNAPAAIGPYSQGLAANGFLFTAGQISLDPETGRLVGGEIEAQTRLTLTNLRGVIEAGGASLRDVVKTTVFLSDMNNFAVMNEVYAEFFTESMPARSTVEVARLPKDVLIEVDAVAVLPD